MGENQKDKEEDRIKILTICVPYTAVEKWRERKREEERRVKDKVKRRKERKKNNHVFKTYLQPVLDVRHRETLADRENH